MAPRLLPAARHDVAVVGFGPVGQLLALQLGRAGHDVVVLERWPRPYDLPRAVHFDDETGRILQNAGVGDAVRAVTDPVPDHYEWRNRHGDPLVRIDWSGTGPSGWPVANFFSQPQLEAVLTEAVGAQPTVTVLRGHEVVDVSDTGEEVLVAALTPQGGTRTLRARYVVGADGANSFVRERIGTGIRDLGFFYDWLIVDVIPREKTTWSPMNWQLCDPARPTTLVSGGPGRRRWEFMLLPGETPREFDTADTAWRLLEPWGRTPDNTAIERHAVYTFQARWAEQWNAGRMLLAGDAAHQMPPFAGQGMCSGLRDAANLSWKLDLVLRGRADASVLDTYTSERMDHLQHAIAMSMELGRVICVLDEEEAAARDARMTAAGADPARALPPMPAPRLGEGILHQDPDGARMPGAGQLTPQHRVTHAGRTALLDDLTGHGFTLLADGHAPLRALGAAEHELLRDLRATVVPLYHAADSSRPADGWTDTDGAYLPYLRAQRHAAALVRPDSYLFGAAVDGPGLLLLVRQLRDRLTTDPTKPARSRSTAAAATLPPG
ncbi:bifunctional 3-(3-hydroxy-phenyl)propionate/3-hydroxycinnamic acid hydroxylase [Actinacidiphila sp. DG2A-62]|uniref:bifunctional 3-(3-hydroxy-phenyl)propionate/3-hydroxycinnamic acid hydroxylase MhpA n=1 Tax=Actinacidiphila sp. DG2A-62 TaxID=3108821 RepID=UPI002DBDED08|nr:bifunctional 3-(3-hydroxy-phenyl)propionate/3-hydroxycinnamic acid hydroxylase [Actinacidiphila sp. DG2A-62]MEC3993766.1 bifunctional 3-(3-hydroxy-phenyl)propionate/3-hydroxycinnamic acid hydroxylase [Actinacidiphila sp. DG2A-62]